MQKHTAVLLACALAGCASGSQSIPEGTSQSSAAIVRAWSPGDVRVEAIDGVAVGSVSHVYVRPGEHQITVKWSGAQSITREGQVRGVLQSRNTYVVTAQPDGAQRTVLFTLVDKGPQYDVQCLVRPTFGSEPKGRGC